MDEQKKDKYVAAFDLMRNSTTISDEERKCASATIKEYKRIIKTKGYLLGNRLPKVQYCDIEYMNEKPNRCWNCDETRYCDQDIYNHYSVIFCKACLKINLSSVPEIFYDIHRTKTEIYEKKYAQDMKNERELKINMSLMKQMLKRLHEQKVVEISKPENILKMRNDLSFLENRVDNIETQLHSLCTTVGNIEKQMKILVKLLSG